MIISVILPLYNSHKLVRACVDSIIAQTSNDWELIIVDTPDMTHGSSVIAPDPRISVVTFVDSMQDSGRFDTPKRQNLAASFTKGDYLLLIDHDMILPNYLFDELQRIAAHSYPDAINISEDSFGFGRWALAKTVERRAYWGDPVVESPRCIRKTTWDKLHGLDESIGAAYDMDFRHKLREVNASIINAQSLIFHDEGQLTLKRLLTKKAMYGPDIYQYAKKRSLNAAINFFPIRKGFLDFKAMSQHGSHIITDIFIMKLLEYAAGFYGILKWKLKEIVNPSEIQRRY